MFLNRGNHEDISCNLSSHFSPNFNSDCTKKFKEYGGLIFKHSVELFKNLPLATVVNNKVGFKCFVVHGGISNRVDFNHVCELQRTQYGHITLKPNDIDSERLSDILWSDPMTVKTKPHFKANGCFPSKRGLGFLFGEDVSHNFCIQNGFNTIVRSHEVKHNK